MLRERSIISEPIIDNEIQEDISELPKPKSKEEKLDVSYSA